MKPIVLTPEEVWQKVANGAVLVDVRTPEEWAEGHFEEALLIDSRELSERIEELEPHQGEEIILFCRSGGRSGKAGEYLISLGYPHIFNGEGYENLLDAQESD